MVLKRIYSYLIFSLFFICGASAQQGFFSDTLFNSIEPQPLSSGTVTCGTLTLVITETDLKCNGDNSGTATVTASGPFGNYTYEWSTTPPQTTATATGLSAGTKSVEVWDSGGNDCVASISITEPSGLIINISPPAISPSCFGYCDGTATANPIGTGTSPYSYLWSNGQTTSSVTGLCSGPNTITVTDANGCVKSKTFVLSQPFPLVSTGAVTTIDCSGNCNGSISLNPSGGTSPYTYSWLPNGETTSAITNLCVGGYTCTIVDSHSCTATYTTYIPSPPALTVTVSGTNLSCNGICNGSVTVSVSGGTPGYTYLWTPGGYTASSVTGLCANTYTLTLRDANNCLKTATVTLTQPLALTSSPIGTNISCFNQCDGTVNANLSGGTSPYTYFWTPSGCNTSTCSNLCNGTYTVNANDANGCPVTGTVTLTQPSLLTVTPSETDVSCVGSCNGTVSATVAGGTTPYTYAWSPSGCTTSACSGLCVGTYSISITDAHGCVATSSVTVSSPAALLPNLSSVAASCFGSCNGSITSAASGGISPYTYNWSSGCTTSSCSNLCAGNYTIQLTDSHGCPATGTITVSQPNVFTVSLASATPNPLNCNGDCNGTAAITVNGGTPTYMYAWSNGATTPSITGLCAGTYSLNATDAHNCPATTSVTFLQATVLTVSVSSTNPTCNMVCDGMISLSPGGGTPAYTYAWLPGGQTTSSISGLCAGNYSCTVYDSKGCSNTQAITLTAPSTLIANASIINNVSCSGLCDGSATASPIGGTTPFTYLWTGGSSSQTVTGLCAGTKNVLVTDSHGCSVIDAVTINQPSTLSSFISSTTQNCSLCNGSATVATAGGTSPYTYAWTGAGQTTTTATGLCTGTYSVTITDTKGCSNIVSASISPLITLTVTSSGPNVSCPGSCDGSATATSFGGTAPYTYSWSTAPAQTTQSATGMCAGTYTISVADFAGCALTNTLTFTNPTILAAAMGSSSASCGLCNGTATVTASGGTGSYTYSWNPGGQTTSVATGLCPGTYSLTLADANNCTTTSTVTVGNIPIINDNPSYTLATCNTPDGGICVSPTGGTPGYSYSWLPSGATTSCINGLASGIYTVTISDNGGCSVPFILPLNNISGPTVTVTSAVDPTCYASCNGSISVSAVGSSSLTYLWNPSNQTTTSISSLCAGTYVVQVQDNIPCSTFSSTTLNNPPQMSANATVNNVSCNGGNNGNICLSPSGGTLPYTYQWLPAGPTTSCISGLSAGTYSVAFSDAIGCGDTAVVSVAEPALLSVSVSATDVTCNGNGDGTATATVTGGTALYTYLWSTGSALPGIAGLIPNDYSITVTDSKGCTGTVSVTITQSAVLTTTATSTNITCNSFCDGTATLTASGGTSPYTYSWLPVVETTSAVTGLCVGNYNAIITDAHGCLSSQSISITEPAALSVTVTSTNSTCFGGCNGTALATANGGSGSYTYLWNAVGQTTSSVTGLCASSYTLSLSDSNGCMTNNIFAISSPSQLQASITNTFPTCFGGCNGTATSSPVGGTGAYTYLWSNGQITSTATGLCAGTYTLTLSDANGCSIDQTTNVVNPTPITIAEGVAGATCLLCNGSISVVANGGTPAYSYAWLPGGQTDATINGLCASLYTVTVTDANGCTIKDTIPVSNTTGPSLVVTGTNISCFGFCNGTTTVSATGDGPAWIYQWNTTPSQTTQSATGLCPNQYFISVTDTFGCITIDPINITEPAQLASNPAVTNATCLGLCSGSISLIPSGGTLPYTYNWLPGGQTTNSISSQCPGNYTVNLTDANACALTTTMTIGQNTILTSTVISTDDSCNSLCDGTAIINVSGGTSPYSYLWKGGQTTSAVNALCAGTFTVATTDAIGCMQIDSAVINQPGVLASNISVINPLCHNDCNGSASAVPTGGTIPYTYLWSFGSATTSSITGLCSGNDTLLLTDAHSCAVTNTITLTNPSLISSTDVETSASCINTSDGSITITPTGGTSPYTFNWQPGGMTVQNPTGLAAGIYSVTITDSNSCSFTDSMTVGVSILVIAHAGNDTSFCLGGTAILNSTSTNPSSIAWYQLPAWTLIGTSTIVNVSPLIGTTNYALIAMNGICSDTDTVAVTVNNYPNLIVSSITTSCLGDTVTLCASGANTYNWYQLPVWTSIASVNCVKVSPPLGVTPYTVIGANGTCSDTDSVSVTVLPVPIASAGNDTAFCSGGSVQLCSHNPATSVAWYQLPSWSLVDTTTCINLTPFISTSFALITSNGICSDTDSVAVTIYPTPTAYAGGNTTILLGGTASLNGVGSGNFNWSPATGLSCTTCANPSANPTVTTTYTLEVTDVSTGCSAIDSAIVYVVPVIVPNDGISPNGDGKNDTWKIPGIELFPACVVNVYNRWGELLYSVTGYNNSSGWDGKYKGKDLPVGTYYYTINLNSALSPDPITGPITIMR